MKAELRDCYVNHLSSAVPALQTSTNPVQTQDSAKETQPAPASAAPGHLPPTPGMQGPPLWPGLVAPGEDLVPGHSLSPWSYSSSDPEHRDTTASGGTTERGHR